MSLVNGPLITACLGGTAKLAWRQRGEKNEVCASAVENKNTVLRSHSATGVRWLFLLTFFYTTLTFTERGIGVVENLGSSRY